MTLLPLMGAAQEALLFQDSHSPLETEFLQTGLRPETRMRNVTLSNPAMMRLGMDERRSSFNDNPQAPVRTYPIVVALQGAGGKMKGDFIPMEGNHFEDYSVVANGVMRGEKSMFYGKASFTAGSHRNIGWNAQRFPMTYWPYVVADSTGGNVSYETYNLLCAYSFRINRHVDLGFSGEYKGDFAFRKTDPRIENITSWLTFKGGMSCLLGGGHRIALDVDYQLHRQHTDIKHFRSGQFAGFFMEYGFGMYDYIHSPIYNSMKHQQHQHSYGANVIFSSNASRPLRATARMGYGFDEMNTEENIHKLNLYRAMTNQLRADASLLWNNPCWGVGLTGHWEMAQRKGREYVFERYVSATVDGVDVYDYRKIGQQDRYKMGTMEGNAQLKVSRYVGTGNTLSLLGGMEYLSREETYKEKNFEISNMLLTPQVGLEMKHVSRWVEARVTAAYARRTSPKDRYEVGVEMDRHTEYQHAFSTYAYYAYEGDLVNLDAELAHTFSFARMGVQVQWMWMNGQRLGHVAYDADRYASQIPSVRKHTVGVQPDRHDQHWMKLTLFAEL